jgi:hypothetical protein
MKTQDFYGTSRSAWRRALALIAATGAVAALSACQTNVAHEQPTGIVLGRVRVSNADRGPVMVVAIDRGTGTIAQRAFLESKRAFSMPLHSGHYKFYACSDDNRDGRCDGSESASVMYSLADRVNAGDVIQLPTFNLLREGRLAQAR